MISLVLSLILTSAHAFDCLPAITLEQFQQTLETTRSTYFPEIPADQLSVTTFESDAYFLQAQPKVKSLVRSGPKRHYKVELNTKLLNCPPSMEALVAILAHELEHVLDYMHWSSVRVVNHGIKYSLSGKVKIKYERETDQKVVERGLSEGLAQYREWVYQWLTKKDLKRKREIYLTPEELRGQDF
jgi:hypothetical protein